MQTMVMEFFALPPLVLAHMMLCGDAQADGQGCACSCIAVCLTCIIHSSSYKK